MNSLKGGQGSGNFGHRGRLGRRGGSSTLREDEREFIEKYPVLYHLTSAGRRESILSNGIRESKRGYSGRGVYLATSPKQTQYYETLESGELVEVDTRKLIEEYRLFHYITNPSGRVEVDEAVGEVVVRGEVPKEVLKSFSVSETLWVGLESAILKTAVVLDREGRLPTQDRLRVWNLVLKGGIGSGNFGHRGRLGLRGGSSSGLVLGGGFDDPEVRRLLKEAIPKVGDLGRSIRIYSDSNMSRYGTAGGGNIYVNPDRLRGKTVEFVAAVLKHESLHVVSPAMSEDDVRAATLDWAESMFDLDEMTRALLSGIDTTETKSIDFKRQHLPLKLVAEIPTPHRTLKTTDQLEQTREWVRKNGIPLNSPIWLRYKPLEVVDGAHRIDFAKEFGIDEIPVKIFNDLGENVDPEIVYREWLSSGETKGVENLPTSRKSIPDELKQWRKFVLNSMGLGRTREFEVKSIPVDLAGSIQDSLREDCLVPSDVRSLFEFHLKTASPYSWRPWTNFENEIRKQMEAYFAEELSILTEYIKTSQSIDPLLIEATWVVREKALRDVLEPILIALVRYAVDRVQEVLSKSEIVIDWNLVNTDAVTWASEYSGSLVKNVTVTTRESVGNLVAQSIEGGWGIGELSSRLQDIRDGAGNQVFGRSRADAIAITESTNAFANANERAWVAGGYPRAVYKPAAHVRCRCDLKPHTMTDGTKVIVWRTSRDERVCIVSLTTPMGTIDGCRGLHNMIVSEGDRLGEIVP